ncbi:hypothetical protein ACLB2K_005887 [Fragaria x ananassa]
MEEVVGNFAKRLALNEAEVEVEVVIPSESLDEAPQRWFLVGELLTTKHFKLDLLVNTMKGLWTQKDDPPDRGRITGSRIGGGNRLLFTFKMEADLKRALRGCPWSFDKALLAMAITNGREDPEEVSLETQLFWIRIRGLPPAYLREGTLENTGKRMGQAIGLFVRAVRGSGAPCLGEFLKIRVGVDITRPLKKWVTFKPDGWSESRRFDLEYERLPHFCFLCGLLTHTGGRCPKKEAGTITVPTYDALINAEKKEEWLLSQHRKVKESPAKEQYRETWRFGLYPRKQSGWTMQAPEMSTVGLVKTKEERDEEQSMGEREEGDMEIDSEGEEGGVSRGVKRRKLFFGGGRPEAESSAHQSDPRNQLAVTTPPIQGSKSGAITASNSSGRKESDLRAELTQSAFKNVDHKLLNVVSKRDSLSFITSGSEILNGPTLIESPIFQKLDNAVLGWDLNRPSLMSPNKEKQTEKKGVKSGQKNKKEMKSGILMKKVVVNALSPNKSPGRTPDRPSVMGPASTHHEP